MACLLLAASLGAAAFEGGGVHPNQWAWSALAISLAAGIALFRPSGTRAPKSKWLSGALAALLGWVTFQLAPLPPSLIQSVSPEHWNALVTARQLADHRPEKWAALSLAPAATWQRLLAVLPAAATFLAAREMAWWWRDRPWVAIAPVIGVAWLESVLGLVQFYLMRTAGYGGSVSGTYANRDHFAGLLEMAFPLALLWALAVWRGGDSNSRQKIRPALGSALLFAVAACLLLGVVVSLSRMGFLSVLAAIALAALVISLRHFRYPRNPRPAWQWAAVLTVPLVIAVFLPTRELVLRFADLTATEEISRDDRIGIWKDTTKVIADYVWTGTGLGAYERGLYRHKIVAPTRTVDFAHNDYLQALAELGIPGAVPAAALAILILSRLVSGVLRRESKNPEWATGLLAALLAIAVHSLADFNLYIPANALTFAWLSGAAASLETKG